MKHKDTIFGYDEYNFKRLQYKYIIYPIEYTLISMIYEYFNQSQELSRSDFLDFFQVNHDSISNDKLTKYYKNVFSKNYNKRISTKKIYATYCLHLNEIADLFEKNNLFKKKDFIKIKEIIDTYFKFDKIDIYSLGISLTILLKLLINKPYNSKYDETKFRTLCSNMIEIDFKKRISIEKMIIDLQNILNMKGGSKSSSSKSKKAKSLPIKREPTMSSSNKAKSLTIEIERDLMMPPKITNKERMENAIYISQKLKN